MKLTGNKESIILVNDFLNEIIISMKYLRNLKIILIAFKLWKFGESLKIFLKKLVYM